MAAPLGNQNARKARIWSEALKRALARYSGSTVDAGLDRLADRMVRAAAEGDETAFAAITEKIGDRLEGKPAQVIVGDRDEDPVQVSGRIVLIKPTEEGGHG
jgi:hypothetical protein